MALLNPTSLNKVLEQSGLPKTFDSKAIAERGKITPEDVKDALSANGIDLNEVSETIRQVMQGADTSAARLKAAEIALKMMGVLGKDDTINNVPSITIVIQDNAMSVNPILIPR